MCESKAHPYNYISIITSCVNIIIVMHIVCFAALVSVTVSNAMPRMTWVSSGWNEVAHNCGWQNMFYAVQHAGRQLPKFSRLTWLDDTADSDRFRPGQFSRTSVLFFGFVTPKCSAVSGTNYVACRLTNHYHFAFRTYQQK